MWQLTLPGPSRQANKLNLPALINPPMNSQGLPRSLTTPAVPRCKAITTRSKKHRQQCRLPGRHHGYCKYHYNMYVLNVPRSTKPRMAAVVVVDPDAPRALSPGTSLSQSSGESQDDSADEIVEEYIDSDPDDVSDDVSNDVSNDVPSCTSNLDTTSISADNTVDFRHHLTSVISLAESITRDLDNLHAVSMLCRQATGRGYSASLAQASGGIKKQISRSIQQMSVGMNAIEAANGRL